MLQDRRARLESIGAFGDDHHTQPGLEHGSQSLARQRLVIDDDGAECLSCVVKIRHTDFNGSVTRQIVPPPARDVIARVAASP